MTTIPPFNINPLSDFLVGKGIQSVEFDETHSRVRFHTPKGESKAFQLTGVRSRFTGEFRVARRLSHVQRIAAVNLASDEPGHLEGYTCAALDILSYQDDGVLRGAHMGWLGIAILEDFGALDSISVEECEDFA